MYALLGAMLVLSAAYMCFVNAYKFPPDVDKERLTSGIESAYTLFGALLGMLVVYIADTKWLHFPVRAKWYVQIIKVIVGLGLVLAVKEGLKAPLHGLMGDQIGRTVRYFLVVFTAGVVWPMTFSRLSNMGQKT